jgi:hypothetical protein
MVRSNKGDAKEISASCGVQSEYMMYRGSTFRYMEETLLGRKINQSIIEINSIL